MANLIVLAAERLAALSIVYYVKLSLILLVKNSHSTNHLKEYKGAVKYFGDIVCIILPSND